MTKTTTPKLPKGFLDQRLLTPREAAEKLQLHPISLSNWRARTARTGKLHGPYFVKLGGKIRYPQHLLEQFVADGLVVPQKVA
jgi:hypothetical protein